ncbi:MAG: TRAP transporter small permease [Thermincola sp.]|jgi:TRAP-type C4-dicarboxylate transport system permease small subunit|nr:TRAP transporter small permease [Thermincola sp.]MDT3701823.1 TRAP transporter small permease [Thermincola sp.]
MNNLVEKASRFMDILARAAVAGIMFTTTLNVILRLFGSSLRGSVEIVQYLTALGIGLGLAYCGFHGGHIAVTFFTDKLPLKLQQFIIVLVEILVAGFLGMTAWQMLLYGQGMQEKNEIALTLGFPIHPIVYLVTAGIVVFLIVVLNNLGKALKDLFSATPAVKAEDNISVDDLISQ